MNLTVARSNLAAACAADRFAVVAGGQIPGRTTVDVLDTKEVMRAAMNALAYNAASKSARCWTIPLLPILIRPLHVKIRTVPNNVISGRDRLSSQGVWGTLDPLNFGRGWLVGAGAGSCVVFASGAGRGNASSVDEYCF